MNRAKLIYKGGPGSGHHGHSGRPGKVGGSSGGGGGSGGGNTSAAVITDPFVSMAKNANDAVLMSAIRDLFEASRDKSDDRLLDVLITEAKSRGLTVRDL